MNTDGAALGSLILQVVVGILEIAQVSSRVVLLCRLVRCVF